MNQVRVNRLSVLATVLCLLLSSFSAVGWAAIPPRTVSNQGSVSPLFNATDNGYWVGANQIVTAGRAATFTTVDTGFGANELYEMNQDVLTVSNVTHNRMTAQEYFLDTDNKTDIFAYPQTEASYTVWVEGATYYSKNGRTGLIATSTDFCILFNSVSTIVGDAGGGSIWVKNGTYTVNSQLEILKPNINLYGSGWGTIFVQKNQPSTTLTTQLNIGEDHIHVVSTVGFNVGERIQISTGAPSEALYISSIPSGVLINLSTVATKNHIIGKEVFGISSTIYFSNSANNVFLRDFAINGNKEGVTIASTECDASYEISTQLADDLVIDHIQIYNSRHRPWRGGGDNILINDCYFWNMTSGGGIHAEGISTQIWRNIKILNSRFELDNSGSVASPCVLTQWGNGFVIENCWVKGHIVSQFTNNQKWSKNDILPNDYAAGYSRCVGENIQIEQCLFNGTNLKLEYVTSGVTYYPDEVTISDCHFQQGAITIYNYANDTKIAGCTFDGSSNPIYIGATTAKHCYRIDISNNNFKVCSPGAYSIYADYANDLKIIANQFVGSDLIEIRHGTGVKISCNTVTSPTGYSFRLLSNTTIITIEDNTVTGCSSRAISLETNTLSPTTPVLIYDNILSATTPYMNDGTYTTGVKIRGNTNYITEKSGTATLLANQNHVHVTHGLSYTPSINDIRITLNGPHSNCTAIWVDPGTITSTEFQVFSGTTAQEKTDANILFAWNIDRH